MRIRHEKYDAWRLFRTVLVAAAAAWLVCIGVTGWVWLVVEPEDDVGQLLPMLGAGTGILGAAVVMSYPWELRRADGSSGPSEPRPSGSGGLPSEGSVTGLRDRSVSS